MKRLIRSNWSFIRLLQTGFGIAIVVQSVLVKDWTLGILGLLLTAMAVFNIGCCGTTACNTSSKKASESPKDISYEEVV